MEIKELEERITKTICRVNNARSISEKRRYYVILNNLLEIKKRLTKSESSIYDLIEGRVMKHGKFYYFQKEMQANVQDMFDTSNSIVETFKSVKWNNHMNIEFKDFGFDYLSEIIEEFFGLLGPKYYRIYQELCEDNRLFRTERGRDAYTVFDYEFLKSYVFVPANNDSLLLWISIVHELGHVIVYELTKYSRKISSVSYYDITAEMFSQFMELIFLDHLRKVNFSPTEVQKMEEHFYSDFLLSALQIRFVTTYPGIYLDDNCDLHIREKDEESALEYLKRLEAHDNLNYYIYGTNVKKASYYMYGGVMADIFRHYFKEDRSILSEIEKHFADYEAYTSKEILDRLPHVREEIQSMSILRHHLKENIKLKHQSFD